MYACITDALAMSAEGSNATSSTLWKWCKMFRKLWQLQQMEAPMIEVMLSDHMATSTFVLLLGFGDTEVVCCSTQ